MKTVAIAVGHGPVKDRGATNTATNTWELDWNLDLAKRIQHYIGSRLNAVIIYRKKENQPPVAAINATRADMAIELHLNAYNGVATGTEMIIYPGSVEGERLGRLLINAAVGELGLRNRGVKKPQNGRGSALLKGTRMPCVIVESGFIDNDTDLAVMNAKKDSLARAYADALAAF